VSNAESYAEANLSPGEYERGTAAQAWKRLRAVRRKLDRTENTIILVDQVRNKLGQTTWQGGKQVPEVGPANIRFLKHNSSLSIEYSAGKKLYMMDDGSLTDDYKKASDDFRALGSDGKEVAGLEMRCKVIKNSTGVPLRNGNMRFCFPVTDIYTGELIQDVGFDLTHELLISAEYYKMVEQDGSRFYPLDDNFQRIPKPGRNGRSSKTMFSWQGEAAARAGIDADDELRERILSRLMLDK
jgi:hypothetical protein